MTYKCLECGHVFKEGEEFIWYENQGEYHGVTAREKLSGCPMCRGAYRETTSCEWCGGDYLDDELYDGWCENCLREAVTYDMFLDFVSETGMLGQFMFETLWGNVMPKTIGEELETVLREQYLRQKADDLLCGKSDFLKLCQRFVMEDDGADGRIYFAEWLNERRAKNGTN